MQNALRVGESLLSRELNYAHKEIRKESNDTYNRLHSIAEDATFISQIALTYPSFKIYPNLRCGAWYVDPNLQYEAQTEPVYFKSTDGHFGQWALNLRRANLHLLDAVSQCEGIILVDSTRRGKTFPDALSKTIPIWCAVVNLAVVRKWKETSWKKDSFGLFTPSGSVSRSEHSQIEAQLDIWAEQLLSSEFSIPLLQKPLRPIWITPSSQIITSLALHFFPVLCVSASKLVHEGLERRSAGFTYVQGSGDDHESWSKGLTPDLYWKNQAQLLSASRSALSSLIASLVVSSAFQKNEVISDTIMPVIRAQSRLSVGMVQSMNSEVQADGMAYIVITSPGTSLSPFSSGNILRLQMLTGKRGQNEFYTQILPQSLRFMKHHLMLGEDIAVLCGDGKDISVGVVVAALSLFFDEEGVCVANAPLKETPTKHSIQKRLQWILADNPRANPSRTTLKRVNEYLMSPPRHVYATPSTIQED